MELMYRHGIDTRSLDIHTDINQTLYDKITAVQVYGIYPFSFKSAIETMKKDGKKIVYDFDDAMELIDESNPFYKDVQRDKPTAKAMFELADVITVATPAFKVYDLGINEGCVTAIKLLQEAIGCDSDGIFGQNTLSMVNSKDCYQDYLNEAEKHYRDIVGKNPKDKKFLNGWLNRLHRSI